LDEERRNVGRRAGAKRQLELHIIYFHLALSAPLRFLHSLCSFIIADDLAGDEESDLVPSNINITSGAVGEDGSSGNSFSKQRKKTNIPSLRQIRKTRHSRGSETRKTDIFGKRVTPDPSAHKGATITLRSVGCQGGTPRLDTTKEDLDQAKSDVEVGSEFKRRNPSMSPKRISVRTAGKEDLPYLDAVADGVLKGEGKRGAKDGWSEGRLERSDSQSTILPTRINITNNLPLFASLLASLITDIEGDGRFSPNGSIHSPKSPGTTTENAAEPEVFGADEDEEGEIEMEQAGSMFQGLGDAVVASNFDASFHVGWKIRGRALLKSKEFTFLVGLTTIYAIVGMETAEATVGSRDYVGLHICSFFSFLFFLFEIVMSCLCIEHYNLSFFFWLDVVGTISLLPDIAFLWPDAWALDGLALARAGRVARTGTRAVRILRFFRIVRMLRLFRVVKLLNRSRDKAVEDENKDGKQQNDEINAYRSRLAKRHAAVVEMRVVTGVILMLIVMPTLEYVPTFNNYLTLEMVQAMLDSGVANSTIQETLEIYKESEATLVYMSAGQYMYQSEATVLANVIETGVDINDDLFPSILAKYELTEEIQDTAVLNIFLTLFLAFLFALGSFVFNSDAHELMFQPIARLTEVTSKVSSQLFNIGADAINGSESSYIESVLTKVARFFDTDLHKVTTLYTPDDAVWTIDVRREKEEVARVVGSTHRITSGDLHNMMKGAKKAMVQRLMFIDFLNDPLAVRYFHTYLASSNEKKDDKIARVGNEFNEDNLLFWEEIRRYRRAISSATYQARHIFKTYVHPEAESALDLSNSIIQVLYGEIFVDERPCIESFDRAEQDVIEIMRRRYFPAFLKSDACQGLVNAKKGLPKAIMVENEFGMEELEESQQMGYGEIPELKLQLSKGKRKTTAAIEGSTAGEAAMQAARLSEMGGK